MVQTINHGCSIEERETWKEGGRRKWRGQGARDVCKFKDHLVSKKVIRTLKEQEAS